MAEQGCANDFELSLRKAYLKGLLALNTPQLFETLAQDPVYFGLLRDWIDRLRLPPARRILEIGCATGGLAAHLAERGHRVTALDRSERMIQAARRAKGRGAVRFVCGELDSPELATHAYDIVIGASLLSVVDRPRQLLQQVPDRLAADGLVSFLFPTRQFSAAGVADYARTRQLSCASRASLAVWQAHAAKLCPHAAIDWLTDCGYVDTAIERCLDGMIAWVRARRPHRPAAH